MTQEVNPANSSPPMYAIPATPEKQESAPSPPKRSKTEIDELITSTSTRSLRDKTNQKTLVSRSAAAARPTPKKTRKITTPSKSGTLIREDDHDCSKVNTLHTREKVTARLIHSMSRFAETYAFNCETKRGTTHINGASSNCGGCHAAHAALSCKLYDNILEVVRRVILEKRLDQLTPEHQLYLKKRFELSEEDEQKFNSENPNERVATFDHYFSQLTDHEKRMSFAGTSIEYERGATYENPIFSNRFDSNPIETKLRKKEDELDKMCSENKMTPIQALIVLQAEYQKLVESAITGLKTDLMNLQNLQESWDALINFQTNLTEETFPNYLMAVDNYLAAYQRRFKERPEGTASLDFLDQYLKDHQSIATLKRLQDNKNALFFQTNKRFLVTPLDSDAQFAKAEVELEGRLTEALYQLDGLQNNPEDFKAMLKYGYGKLDLTGVVKTPNKLDMAEVFTQSFGEKSKKRDLTGDFLDASSS